MIQVRGSMWRDAMGLVEMFDIHDMSVIASVARAIVSDAKKYKSYAKIIKMDKYSKELVDVINLMLAIAKDSADNDRPLDFQKLVNSTNPIEKLAGEALKRSLEAKEYYMKHLSRRYNK